MCVIYFTPILVQMYIVVYLTSSCKSSTFYVYLSLGLEMKTRQLYHTHLLHLNLIHHLHQIQPQQLRNNQQSNQYKKESHFSNNQTSTWHQMYFLKLSNMKLSLTSGLKIFRYYNYCYPRKRVAAKNYNAVAMVTRARVCLHLEVEWLHCRLFWCVVPSNLTASQSNF